MTRFLMIAGAAAMLALPAVPALACSAHDHSASATSVDLAAAAKKVMAPATSQDTTADTKAQPAK